MSGPDFAGVIDGHFYDTGWRCSCGWTGSVDEWTAHLSAALHAELARWLADEGTREVVADAFSRGGVNRPLGATVREWRRELATTALAALTTTDQEADR